MTSRPTPQTLFEGSSKGHSRSVASRETVGFPTSPRIFIFSVTRKERSETQNNQGIDDQRRRSISAATCFNATPAYRAFLYLSTDVHKHCTCQTLYETEI